jgi:hypothetical protein
MNIEEYLHMYNELARSIGMSQIVRIDAPHEKGKPIKRLNYKPFHSSFSR